MEKKIKKEDGYKSANTKKKIFGRVFCDYEAIVECLRKGGATDLELHKLHTSLVRTGGFVDQQATTAFAMKIKSTLPPDKKESK